MPSCLGAAPIHEGGLHFLRDRTVLLDALALKSDNASIIFAGFFLLQHTGMHMNCVSMLHRAQHPPAVDLQQREKRAIIDTTRILQSAHDCVNEWPVRYRLAELGRLTVFEIGVNLVEVA